MFNGSKTETTDEPPLPVSPPPTETTFALCGTAKTSSQGEDWKKSDVEFIGW